MKKITVIGGGSGLHNILIGLKELDVELNAIVTTSDNGGSTGKLLRDFDVLPMGDIRNVLESLANPDLVTKKVFSHRFKKGDIEGHSLGNLIITALLEEELTIVEAINFLKKILDIKHNVYPISFNYLQLHAEFIDGTSANGETEIREQGKKIKRLYYNNDYKINNDTIKAIEDSDLILIGPGSLYTSIIPNLLFDEIKHALNTTKAKLLYVCNIMTEKGETDNMTNIDHINAINDHLGERMINEMICDETIISKEVVNRYKKQSKEKVKVIEDNNFIIHRVNTFIDEDNAIRHDAKVIAKFVSEYY